MSIIILIYKGIYKAIYKGIRIMINVVYEDKDMIVVLKKAGQLVQSGKGFDADLAGEVLTYRRRRGEDVYAALINRLDRNVSGLVVFAKNRQSAAKLSKLIRNEGFNKHYYACVCGKLPADTGTFVDYLKKDEKANVSKMVSENTEGAKYAKLEYEVVRETECDGKILSLVKIHLITGRHHQIRVQFAGRGLPLIGDVKYGGYSTEEDTRIRNIAGNAGIQLGRGEIALCAYSLEIMGKAYEISPSWM